MVTTNDHHCVLYSIISFVDAAMSVKSSYVLRNGMKRSNICRDGPDFFVSNNNVCVYTSRESCLWRP